MNLFPRVMEGVEVQRVIDILILHFGLPIGGIVVTSFESVDLSVSAMGDKRVLLHRVEIICMRKEKSCQKRGGWQDENIVAASALRKSRLPLISAGFQYSLDRILSEVLEL